MIEYKVIEINVPPDLLAISQDPEVREKISLVIEETLNKYGKEGWKLHMSGLTSIPTLVLERQKK